MHSQVFNILLEQIAEEDSRRNSQSRLAAITENIFLTIKSGDAEALKPFIDFKLANLRDSFGYSPLVIAAGHGRDEVVNLLVRSGCDIHNNVKIFI